MPPARGPSSRAGPSYRLPHDHDTVYRDDLRAGGDDRVDVHFEHARTASDEVAHRADRGDKRGLVRSRQPAHAGEKPAPHTLAQHLLCLAVRHRGEPDRDVADRLREHAAGADSDNGTEARVPPAPEQQLNSGPHPLLHDDALTEPTRAE